MGKHLTLIGRGPSWKECLFQTEELWGVITCLITEGLADKKYTKVFCFDNDTDAETKQGVEIAKERGIPIVSKFPYATELFPVREVVREFRSSYFMPTMSYMIAYAIFLGYERLYIYGIDQGSRWDYQAGKTHIAFWLGVATGRGVDLRLGRGSLSWAYRTGLNEMPAAFLEEERNRIANHVSLAGVA